MPLLLTITCYVIIGSFVFAVLGNIIVFIWYAWTTYKEDGGWGRYKKGP